MKNKKLDKVLDSLKKESKKNKSYIYKKKLINALYQSINNHKQVLIKSIMIDTKKEAIEAIEEIKNSLNILKFVLKNINNIKDKSFNKRIFKGQIIYEPMGLVALITPWNYPLITIIERLPFILGSGNSVIIKPSEFTLNFSKILRKIINNNKILNKQIYVIVDKNKQSGKMLCYKDQIDMIAFVGSIKNGKKIILQSAKNLKKTSLELGGKNPAIFYFNNFSNKYFSYLFDGIFENKGQSCVAISRILILNNQFKYFKKFFLEYVTRRIKKENSNLFSVANKNHYKRVKNYIKYLKLRIPKNKINFIQGHNNLLTPMFIDNSENKFDKFLKEEFFFPIVSLEKFKNLSDLLKKVNSTRFGLACYIYSDKKEISRLISKLDFGRIWINSSTKKWSPLLPVGGKKESGKSFDMGENGFNNYILPKSIYKEKYS